MLARKAAANSRFKNRRTVINIAEKQSQSKRCNQMAAKKKKAKKKK